MKLAAIIAACALVMAGGGPSLSQEGYPARPIRLLVGFPPGTATDLVARQIAEGVKRNTGWVIYVDNKVGQSGSIAARELVRSAPDGYTLLATANGRLITNPNLYGNVEYDTLRDFTPVGQIATLPYILVVNSSKPYGVPDDLVQQWGRELQKVVNSPDQKERLAQVGANAEWMSAADFTKFLQTEVANGTVMVRESGAKLE